MTPEQTYTIGELAQAAEVTPRTIRYYVAEELLPPPSGGGRAAVYNKEHLARLQLIKVLKDEFLPLQEIRALLNGLNDTAVVDLLQQKQHSPKPPPGSAKQYLQMLLYPATPPDEGAGFMRHRVQAKKAAPGEMGAAPSQSPAPPAPAPAARQRGLGSAAGAGEPGQNPGPPNPLAVGRAEEIPPTRWQRIEIRPGLELHVMDDPENQEFWPKIKQLLMVARQIFK